MADSHLTRPCPFCNHEYRKLGNHLPYCPQRKGRDYSCFLAKTTLQKKASSRRQPCPHCGGRYLRLDTHLRRSAQCATVTHQIEQPSSGFENHGPQSAPLHGPSFATLACHTSQANSVVPSPSVEAAPSTVQLRPFNHPQSPDEWAVANEDLANTIVPAVLAAPTVEEKNRILCEGIFCYFTSRFGSRKQKARRKSRCHTAHRETLTTLREKRNKARNDLRRAKKQGNNPTDLTTLAKAFHRFLREYKKVSRAEKRRENKAEASTARIQCAKNFAKFAKQVLDDDPNNVDPEFDLKTTEQFFSRVYSSTPRVYEQPSWLPNAPPPQHPFQQGAITTLELTKVIQKVRGQAAPSPLDQITYRVIKQCPSLIPALLNLFGMCWDTQTIPHVWKQGVIRLIPKASAKENPCEPSNFRPIALTSCVGKLFTTVLKNRWLRFMTLNGYLDTTVQKAFLPGIPGCLEQYEKLMAIINEAHRKHRSLTVCWLDLANAYGSVHHQLINFCLHHYHAPKPFLDTITCMYSNLSATVTSKSWSTRSIPLKVGVYQGDPLSVIIFNTVMATLADALKADRHLGYTLSGGKTTNVLQYADDTCLVANGPASCQSLLHRVERWLEWTGMRAKVSKCQSLGLQASSAKRSDPQLHLNGDHIPFIGTNTIRFLGGPVQVPLDTSQHRAQLAEKLDNLLQRVDSTPVTRKQKLLLFRAGVCPRLTWDLAILHLPITWVTRTLEATATRYVKKWLGLTRSANTAHLYLPKASGGLGLPSISLLYKKLKVSQATLLLTSRDPVTQQVAKGILEVEERQSRLKFKPMHHSQETMSEDPGASKRALMMRAKVKLVLDDADSRADQARALPRQGQLLREGSDMGAQIWASAVSLLSSENLKFALNAATDTLPHNANLALWRGLNDGCRLCGKRQTLSHVLNHCEVALKLRRYNRRHDIILSIMTSFFSSNLQSSYKITADLDASYHFPSHITSTDLRPDIVMWSDLRRTVLIVELTICFETNYVDAHERKKNKYLSLMEEIQGRGYCAMIVPIQVGSRGMVEVEGFERLQMYLTITDKKLWKQFLIDIAKRAIEESQRIWVERNWEVS